MNANVYYHGKCIDKYIIMENNIIKYTVVGDYINIIKTTFDFKFDLYQALKQHGHTKTWKQREAVKKKNFSL